MRQQLRLWFAVLLMSETVLAQSIGRCEHATNGLMTQQELGDPSGGLDMSATITNDGNAEVSLAELRARRVIPIEAWNVYRSALKADRRGDHAAALSLAANAVTLAPNFFQAHAALAVSDLRAQDFKAAEEQIRIALRLDPSYLPGRELLGISAFLRGNLSDSVAILQDVLKSGPGRPATHYFLALAFCEMNQCDRALEHFETAQRLRRHPPQPIPEAPDDWTPINDQ